MRYIIYIFVIIAAIMTWIVLDNYENAKNKEPNKEIKKENFKVGDVVIEIKTQLYYIVIDEKEMECKVPKGEIPVKQIKNGQKYKAYPEEIRKATKIEEFIFKNGGKENE